MGGTGSPGTISDEPEARQQEPTGAWAGYVIFALCVCFLTALDVQDVYYHSWARFTGVTVITLALVIVPTGGVTWLWRSLRRASPGLRPPR